MQYMSCECRLCLQPDLVHQKKKARSQDAYHLSNFIFTCLLKTKPEGFSLSQSNFILFRRRQSKLVLTAVLSTPALLGQR
jgi:hypothetical protein